MTLNKIKRRILEDWLQFKTVQIRVSRRAPGVRLPDHLPEIVTLNLNMGFRGEMSIREDGVDVLLSFSGCEFDCFIPWDAVLGITHEQFGDIMFPHAAPPGMSLFLVRTAPPEAPAEAPPPAPEPETAPEPPEAAEEPPAPTENVVSLFGRRRP